MINMISGSSMSKFNLHLLSSVERTGARVSGCLTDGCRRHQSVNPTPTLPSEGWRAYWSEARK